MHPYKASREFQRELLDTGTSMDSSTARRRFIEDMRFSRTPIEKRLLTPAMKENVYIRPGNINPRLHNMEKRLYSATNRIFLYKGFDQNLSGEEEENPSKNNILLQQVLKNPQKQMFWDYFTPGTPYSLVPVEKMMNSKNNFYNRK
ncbi:hypothetical protein TNCT_347851 [Trichonephila clavata]|uniref:Uncharacterized protein n=1 Tax=Trichonephila clavata TaxID=2740835 RepID=A0A8X6HUT7_TRICU|nr:hypothetical protein TNCT_347851 [Trichonephila clavata]